MAAVGPCSVRECGEEIALAVPQNKSPLPTKHAHSFFGISGLACVVLSEWWVAMALRFSYKKSRIDSIDGNIELGPGSRAFNLLVVEQGPMLPVKLRRALAGWDTVTIGRRCVAGVALAVDQFDVALLYAADLRRALADECIRGYLTDVTLPWLVLVDSFRPRLAPRAFEAGARDILTSSISGAELRARLAAAGRSRVGWHARKVASGSSDLHPASTNALIDASSIEGLPSNVDDLAAPDRRFLRRAEFNLLTYLIERAGQVVTHDDLSTAVFGRKNASDMSLVRVHVANLRRKLGPYRAVIRTAFARGYVFDWPSVPAGMASMPSSSAADSAKSLLLAALGMR